MPKRNFTDEDELEIARMYKAGLSAKAIGRLLGLNHHISITAALGRTNTPQRPPGQRNEKYYVDPHAFDTIDNEAKAYWWGFLYADGYVRKRSVILTLSRKDKSHVAAFKRFLKSSHPLKAYIRTVKEKPYPVTQLFVTNEHLVNRLKILGITVDRTTFEWNIKQLSPELIHHWIRGFFDGDGHISKPGDIRPIIKICGKPEVLGWIRQIFHIKVDRRIDQRIYKHKTANVHYLDYSGGIQCRAIRDYLYKDATVYLYRKRNRFFQLKPPQPPYNRRNSKGRFIKR